VAVVLASIPPDTAVTITVQGVSAVARPQDSWLLEMVTTLRVLVLQLDWLVRS
jgi:hypothetical protein